MRSTNGYASDAAINMGFLIVGGAVVAIIAWVFWRAWDDTMSPTYRIRRDQWTCTDARTRSFAIMDGKYGSPHTQSQTTCWQYTRTGRTPLAR